MSAELPAPLAPADCDLRDYAFMPLDVARFRDSDLAATLDAESFRAAIMLWCASWHQVPAGSVPDNDTVLARLAGFGRFVDEWLKVKAAAMTGFRLCSDGRLYHPVVCAKAREAWAKKQAFRQRAAAGGRAKAARKTEQKQPAPPFILLEAEHKQPQAVLKPAKGQGQGQGQREDPSPASTVEVPSDPVGAGVRSEAPPEKPLRPKSEARGTRIAEDWRPGPAEYQYALDEGLSPQEVDREAAKFADYFRAKPGAGGRRLDWPATWRNWIRTACERRGGAGVPVGQGPGGGRQRVTSLAGVAARRRGLL